MKRIGIPFLLFLFFTSSVSAQTLVNDTMGLFLDSLYMELPEVMINGEHPIVKVEEGKLIYDLPRLIEKLPIDNAYDAIKELPGIAEMDGKLTLLGGNVNVVINGRVSTLTTEQLADMLKTLPVSNIEKAEVMHSAPARYQVRGAMVNLVLKSNEGSDPNLHGELYTSWVQKHYEQLTERASLIYSSSKFSADLLYSFGHGRKWTRIDKEALHTVNGTAYPMDLSDGSFMRKNTHNVRLGMDYHLSETNALHLVYTAQLMNNAGVGWTTGTQTSQTRDKGDAQLHNVKLDYQSSFGLSAGAEMTYHSSPGTQELHSLLNDDLIDAHYEDAQRINRWRFYLTQEHNLKNGWGFNYGANYTTAVDNSHQYYYDNKNRMLHPDKSMRSRRREYTLNGFAGLNKVFSEQLSFDASLAAELFHTETWDEWVLYPTLNLNYTPRPEHIFQLSLFSDKDYPAYWSMQNSVSYMSAYTEFHGNPHLKPTAIYDISLTYILNGKYMFIGYFKYDKDYSVQTLYQQPDRLVEVYKELNADFAQQFGLQAVIPFSIGNWFSSKFMAIGFHQREKSSHFWDISYDRRVTSFMTTLNNTFILSTKPDISFNLYGYYQNGNIQGIYDLGNSGSVDAALTWTFAKEKARLVLKGSDLFNTSIVSPEIHYKGQNLTNRFLDQRRAFEISFSYKFGNYKEKEREGVDTSRFK